MTTDRAKTAAALLNWSRSIPYVPPTGPVCDYCLAPTTGLSAWCSPSCKTMAWKDRRAA